MNYNYRYRLHPTDAHRETLDYHRDICRQLYNHALYRFNQIPERAGTVKQRVRTIRDELPDLKTWWDELTDVYAKVLQPTVMRIRHNVNALGELKDQGYKVGELKWKPPREFRSFTYNQSGFELDKKSGQTVLSLSKLADIPIQIHHQNRRFWLAARTSGSGDTDRFLRTMPRSKRSHSRKSQPVSGSLSSGSKWITNHRSHL